jgi:hypothetical protein
MVRLALILLFSRKKEICVSLPSLHEIEFFILGTGAIAGLAIFVCRAVIHEWHLLQRELKEEKQ